MAQWWSEPWTRMTAMALPVAASQIRADLSELAGASQVPSGAIATAVTGLVWPVRWWRCWPVAASQIRAELSWLAVASQVPSGCDRHRPHPVSVAGEVVALLAGGGVPDPRRFVLAGGGQPGAVRCDRHHLHARVAEVVALLAGGGVPDPRRVVPAGGG